MSQEQGQGPSLINLVEQFDVNFKIFVEKFKDLENKNKKLDAENEKAKKLITKLSDSVIDFLTSPEEPTNDGE